MKDITAEAIKELISKSKEQNVSGDEAVKYSQAALNLAHAYDRFYRTTNGCLD